jgi:hypothetical protein
MGAKRGEESLVHEASKRRERTAPVRSQGDGGDAGNSFQSICTVGGGVVDERSGWWGRPFLIAVNSRSRSADHSRVPSRRNTLTRLPRRRRFGQSEHREFTGIARHHSIDARPIRLRRHAQIARSGGIVATLVQCCWPAGWVAPQTPSTGII